MRDDVYRTATACSKCIASYDALIARSKAHWDWPDGYLEQALDLMRITSDYLDKFSAFELLWAGELVGFYAVLVEADRVTLDHLWIEPHFIGRGAGRFAVAHVVGLARDAARSAIDVWPDPPAEPFYQRQGFTATCDWLPSRIPAGPTFRRFSRHVTIEDHHLLEA